MINENVKKELMTEVVRKLTVLFMLYEDFKHMFEDKGCCFYKILNEATELSYDEINSIRKKVFIESFGGKEEEYESYINE